MQSRNITFDIIKFFAIFCVVWGHCIQHLLSSEYWEEPIYRYLYSFHMPLFMMVAGFFAANINKNKTFWSSLTTKFRQLIIPLLSSCVIICILDIYANQGGYFYHLYKSLWFLKSLFLCNVLYLAATTIVDSSMNKRILLILLSLILSNYIRVFLIPQMYPCFIVGVLLRFNYDYFKRNTKIINIISGMLFLILLLFWDERFWSQPGTGLISKIWGEDYVVSPYIITLIRYSVGVLGSIFFISLFHILSSSFERSSIGLFISYCGQFTLGIYIFQTFILEIVLANLLKFDSFNWMITNFIVFPILSIVIILSIIWIVRYIGRNKYISFLLLGKSISVMNNSVGFRI